MDRKELLKRRSIELCEIEPNQDNPREDFSDESLGESIKEVNMKDPIKVRLVSEDDKVPSGRFFIIIDGDRRFEVLCDLYPAEHLLKVGKDVIIDDLTREKAYDVNITINMQRKNYNLREECNIVDHYKGQGLSQREIRKKCNRSKGWVVDRLNLLNESPEIQARIFSGELNLTDYRTKVVACDQFESADVGTSEVVDQPDEHLPLVAPKETIDTKVGFQFKLSDKNITKFLCLKNYSPFQELILNFNPNENIVTVHAEKEHLEALEILKRFAAYLLNNDMLSVVKTYKNAQIINELPSKDGARVDVIWKDSDDKKEFDLLLQRYKKPKVQVPIDNRTTVLTKQQFEAIRKSMTDFFKKVQSYQTIDKLVHVRWRDYDDHLNTIKWILQNKDDFPLDGCQLERYTPLTAEQISTILENGQARKKFYLTTHLPLEAIKEAIEQTAPGVAVELHQEPNHYSFFYNELVEREQITAYIQKENARRRSMQKDSSVEDLVWRDLTPEEHSALPEYLSSLVLRKEHLKAEDKIRLFFKDWTEQNQVANYFSPAQDFFKQLEKLPFPLDEDLIQLVHTNTLNMIEFNWKFFKKYYPRLYQEYIETKKLWSEFSKTFTVSLFTRFHSKIGYIKIQIDNLKNNLQWVRENTIISPDGQVLVFSYCTKCFKQKRLRLDQNICGNCELSNSQQQKKAAAASNPGGVN